VSTSKIIASETLYDFDETKVIRLEYGIMCTAVEGYFLIVLYIQNLVS